MIKRQLKRFLILGLAVIFLLLGLAGLVLPLLQGWFFLALSLILFSLYSPTIRNWMDTHTVKYPKLHGFVRKAEEWVVRVIGRPE